MWRQEALKFEQIRKIKKELKRYRRNFSIEGLYIEKTKCENFIDFHDLVDKHYFQGIDKTVYTKKKLIRKIKRKIRRITGAQHKRHIYTLCARMLSKKGKG